KALCEQATALFGAVWASAPRQCASFRLSLPSRSCPHSVPALSLGCGGVHDGGMSSIAQGFDSASGDPHQALVDAVRTGGAEALAALLGDQTFVLQELALRPRELFTAGDVLGASFTAVVGRIHELRSAMDALEARAIVALADSLTLHKQAEARARTAQEADQAPPSATLLREASREAAREVSMVVRKSPAAAAHSLASQRRLVADMPEMLTALATAQVTSTTAHGASRSFAPLSPTQRAA